ncbi:hypothetical protein [Streptomyces sp. A1277]|nr:hypothetical protein [Streptomyces sp. A1277]
MTPSRYPSKPRPGDRVAVLSPSSGLPGAPHPLTAESLRAALFSRAATS